MIILTEGTRTEVIYFEALVQKLRRSDVKVIAGKSPDPVRLLNQAIQFKKDNHQLVWVVLDAEIPGRNPVRDRHLKKALEGSERYGVEFAIAEPCFEAWLLAHFEQIPSGKAAHQSDDYYRSKLSKVLGQPYDKGHYDPSCFLAEEKLETAVESVVGKRGLARLLRLLK